MFSFFYSSYEAWESGQILIIAIAIAYMRQMCAHRDHVAGVWRCCWLWQRRCRPPWGGTLPPGSCWMIPFRLWIFCLSISLRSGGENPSSTVGFSGRWSGGTLPCPWRRLWSRHSSNPPSGSRGSRCCSSSRRGVGRSRSTSWSEVHGRRIFRLKGKRQRWKKMLWNQWWKTGEREGGATGKKGRDVFTHRSGAQSVWREARWRSSPRPHLCVRGSLTSSLRRGSTKLDVWRSSADTYLQWASTSTLTRPAGERWSRV